jgi:hypothetical protein
VGSRGARDRDQIGELSVGQRISAVVGQALLALYDVEFGAVGGIRTRDLRVETPESWTARRRQHDQQVKWLLEQGSNLQALRHLLNRQARLPNSAIQDQKFAYSG